MSLEFCATETLGLAKKLGLVGQQIIETYPFEGGADVLVGVAEQQVAAELFDRELDGFADQQLITSFDREIFDGVASFGELEYIGTSTANEGVITFAAMEPILTVTAF